MKGLVISRFSSTLSLLFDITIDWVIRMIANSITVNGAIAMRCKIDLIPITFC